MPTADKGLMSRHKGAHRGAAGDNRPTEAGNGTQAAPGGQSPRPWHPASRASRAHATTLPVAPVFKQKSCSSTESDETSADTPHQPPGTPPSGIWGQPGASGDQVRGRCLLARGCLPRRQLHTRARHPARLPVWSPWVQNRPGTLVILPAALRHTQRAISQPNHVLGHKPLALSTLPVLSDHHL